MLLVTLLRQVLKKLEYEAATINKRQNNYFRRKVATIGLMGIL